MKRWAGVTAAIGMIGAAVGLLAGSRWMLVCAGAGGPETAWSEFVRSCPTVLVLLVAGIVALAWVILRAAARPRAVPGITLAASLGAGAVAYLLLDAVYCAISTGLPLRPAVISMSALLAALLAAAARRWRWSLAAALIGSSFVPQTHRLHLIAGDELARMSLRYGPLPGLDYYISLAATLALIGGLAGWFFALVTADGPARQVALGVLAGIGAAAAVGTTQTVLFVAAMGSGQSPGAVVSASILAWVLACACAPLAWFAHKGRGAARLARLAPLAFVLAAAEYVFIAAYGYGDYAALQRFGPDSVFAYVHFTAAGTWTRSVDVGGSAQKAARADDFLSAYPHSAYRPAAMLVAAESRFELWEFREAARLLAALERSYPALDGYASVLRSLADLAAGRPRTILRPAPEMSRFARVRRSQGAQMAAQAAERLGQPLRARGLHSAYIDYLLSRPGTSWTSRAVAFSRRKMNLISRSLDAGPAPPSNGTVAATVTIEGKPMEGVRVILVQPRQDAALPRDSRQFTGPWTLPAWSGVWGISDRSGQVRIEKVPSGEYEVVIGVQLKPEVRGFVISSPAAPVNVKRGDAAVRAIRFVRAVELASPSPGGSVQPSGELVWKPYPGAHHYSVSVVCGRSTQRRSGPGVTCWAKPRIGAPRTSLDSAYFINGCHRLQAGSRYMWIVYAYDSAGHPISSSEHYFDVREPEFLAR